MARTLLSLWVWVSGFILAILWVPLLALVYVLTAPGDPGRYTVGRWFRRAAVAVTKLNPLWRFRTEGVRIADPRRPYVAVANHESFADIFLISHLPWEMKWLSKEAIFKIPFMGWMMRMAGDIQVRRSEARSRAQALEDCRDRLMKKVSVMIMPEGTRSASGELGEFKDGAFRLAVETGSPILPIAVVGTRHAIAKGSWKVGRANAVARVLPPIETVGLTLADVPALRERARAMIGEARAALQRELGLDGRSEPRPVAQRA
ncbi:MAG TPA: lysophospholipid acyltransferase family protein [Longimicrobium sp.]|nr:lysophospholipid acyltransferase family protein [Longimicrobium sp.]